MKKQFLFFLVGLSLIILGSGALVDLRAQAKNKTAALGKIQKISPEEQTGIEQIVRARLAASNTGPGNPCNESLPINFDQPLNGALASTDCRRPTNQLIDFYSFEGMAGRALSISLNSSDLDTYLILFDPAGNIVAQNDDGGSALNSRIPDFGGEITLPVSGTYLIGASSADPETGAYTLTLNGTTRCLPASLIPNQIVSGSITAQDCIINTNDEFFYKDLYTFEGLAGQQISIAMNSSAVDAYLILHTPSGAGRLEDNNGGGGTDARIPAGTMTITLTQTGTYTVEAGTFESGDLGDYSLILNAGAAPVTVRAPFDFDGDGQTDLSIFRPSVSEWWYRQSGGGQVSALQFGSLSDKPAAADFTGDGRADLAFWRPASGEWFILRSENGSFYSFPFGISGDIPVPADYDGDGRADAAVFRPARATWLILRSTDGGTSIVTFGLNGDKPVAGDYDGDGKADLAVFRNTGSTGAEWWYVRSSDNQTRAATFGASGDQPVQGDYTGDGKTDLAVFRPLTGEWFIVRSEDASYYSFPFGTTGDIPAAGDYDGDGRIDAAVFRPSNATWFALRSTTGTLITNFGTTGDLPVPSIFVP